MIEMEKVHGRMRRLFVGKNTPQVVGESEENSIYLNIDFRKISYCLIMRSKSGHPSGRGAVSNVLAGGSKMKITIPEGDCEVHIPKSHVNAPSTRSLISIGKAAKLAT